MSTYSCSCGNIRIRGQIVPHSVYPNIPSSEKEHLRCCRNLFTVQSQCIEIHNFNNIQARSLSKICSELKCTTCGSLFLFFYCNGYSYFGRTRPKITYPPRHQQDTNCCKSLTKHPQILSIKKPNDNRKMTGSLPSFLKPLISNQKIGSSTQEIPKKSTTDNISLNEGTNLSFSKAEDNDFMSSDIDFELMFSNKVEPIVGSYKQDMNVPLDSSLGSAFYCDIQPNSYFA